MLICEVALGAFQWLAIYLFWPTPNTSTWKLSPSASRVAVYMIWINERMIQFKCLKSWTSHDTNNLLCACVYICVHIGYYFVLVSVRVCTGLRLGFYSKPRDIRRTPKTNLQRSYWCIDIPEHSAPWQCSAIVVALYCTLFIYCVGLYVFLHIGLVETILIGVLRLR